MNVVSGHCSKQAQSNVCTEVATINSRKFMQARKQLRPSLVIPSLTTAFVYRVYAPAPYTTDCVNSPSPSQVISEPETVHHGATLSSLLNCTVHLVYLHTRNRFHMKPATRRSKFISSKRGGSGWVIFQKVAFGGESSSKYVFIVTTFCKWRRQKDIVCKSRRIQFCIRCLKVITKSNHTKLVHH